MATSYHLCKTCGETNPENFENGRYSTCISCRRKQKKISEQRKRKDAGVLPRGQYWRGKPVSTETQQERRKRYHQAYAINHPDRVAQNIEDGRQRQWKKRRERNAVIKPISPPELRKERRQQTKADWQNNNRVARQQRDLERFGHKIDYKRVKELSGSVCYICQKPIKQGQKLHYDHVIPIALGGKHCEDNVRQVHDVCNQRKNKKLFEEMSDHDKRGPD